jgi:hypothetical protein
MIQSPISTMKFSGHISSVEFLGYWSFASSEVIEVKEVITPFGR